MARVWKCGSNQVTLPKGVEVREGNDGRAPLVGIRFKYRGVPCRELALPCSSVVEARRSVAVAQEKLSEIKIAMARGTFKYGVHFPDSKRCEMFGERRPIDPNAITFGKIITEYFENGTTHLEAVSKNYYKRQAALHVLPFWEDKTVSSYNHDEVERYLAELADKGMVLKSARNAIIPLNEALDRAVTKRARTGIDRNILRDFSLEKFFSKEQRRSDYEVNPFNEQERAAILAALDKVSKDPAIAGQRLYTERAARMLRNMLLVWWWGGYRPEEIISLKWVDVDFEQERVHVRRKNARGQILEWGKTDASIRFVPLIGPALEALKDQRELTKMRGHGFIFENPFTGTPYKWTQNLSNFFWPTLLKRAGVAHRGPNQNRHTFASLMFGAGEDENTVSKMMGHRDSRTTRAKYARMIRDPQSKHGYRLRGDYSRVAA